MSSLPRWWPYRITLEEAGRRLVVLLAGVIVGANAVTHYYKPLQEFQVELARGKTELLYKYKAIHDERLRKAAEYRRQQQ